MDICLIIVLLFGIAMLAMFVWLAVVFEKEDAAFWEHCARIRKREPWEFDNQNDSGAF